ncbi:MAG: MlaD family protein [Eudoraea sp.]|nr:MlaD family protein [Eudoraea sp.]
MVSLSKEFKVGLFAIATVAMFYMGFNYLKGIEFFSRSNRYYVVYQDVGGLTKSNPVKISGFTVGRVAEIRLLQRESNNVLVGLDIDRNIILGDSAIARLDASLMGEVSIVVSVGNIDKPLDPLDTLYAMVNPEITELLVESTQPITDNLPATIANLNNVLRDLEGVGEKTKDALESFTRTSNTLNQTIYSNKAKLSESVEQINQMAKKMNQIAGDLKPLIAKFNTTADSLNNLELKATFNKMDNLLDELTKTTAAFNNKQSSLGKLMNEDSLYQSLNKTLLDLDTLLLNINNNPKHFFAPLGKSAKKIQKDRAKQESQQE